mmetsp:Transcript_93935/g.223511  ORF Transcript_93935/g.223511 Transcript_93935/m.223511 type:complete len:324 (+) Transcript_93935:262-1233(+)
MQRQLMEPRRSPDSCQCCRPRSCRERPRLLPLGPGLCRRPRRCSNPLWTKPGQLEPFRQRALDPEASQPRPRISARQPWVSTQQAAPRLAARQAGPVQASALPAAGQPPLRCPPRWCSLPAVPAVPAATLPRQAAPLLVWHSPARCRRPAPRLPCPPTQFECSPDPETSPLPPRLPCHSGLLVAPASPLRHVPGRTARPPLRSRKPESRSPPQAQVAVAVCCLQKPTCLRPRTLMLQGRSKRFDRRQPRTSLRFGHSMRSDRRTPVTCPLRNAHSHSPPPRPLGPEASRSPQPRCSPSPPESLPGNSHPGQNTTRPGSGIPVE